MSKNTILVEYFGLPGCGKTTLCSAMHDKNDKECSTTSELSREFSHSSFLIKVLSFPWYILFPLIRLWFAIPFAGLKHLNRYKIFIIREMFCNFACKYSKLNKVLIDHGLAQSIIVLIYDKSESFNRKTLKLFSRVLARSKVSEIVYCKVAPETSLRRIRKRNRQTPGRSDAIKDDTKLLQNLYMQQKMYDSLAETIKETIGDRYSVLCND